MNPAGAPEGSEPETSETPWERCHAAFSTSGDPRADLDRLTSACGGMNGMRPITPVQTGTQSDREPVHRYTFHVAQSGKCYRVYATGSTSIVDLDLLVRDPIGAEVAADLTQGSSSVLPPREPLCFDRAGLYVLEVSVYRGSGDYAVQVWGK